MTDIIQPTQHVIKDTSWDDTDKPTTTERILHTYTVTVTADEIRLAKKYQDECATGKKASSDLHDSKSPEGAELVGKIGEFGFGQLIDQTPDLEYREGGDGGIDFVVDGKKIDVKAKLNPKANLWVLDAVKENGRKVMLTSDYYVFVRYDIDLHCATVEVMGWLPRGAFDKRRTVAGTTRDGGYGAWKNYEVSLDELKPIEELLRELGHDRTGD